MEKRYKQILQLIYTSVVEEGGDGDATWYLKYSAPKHILPLLEQFNKEHNTGWEIDYADDRILWGTNQEWVLITNNKSLFDSQPDWSSLKIQG